MKKMYDFGELGKWSNDSIMAQIDYDNRFGYDHDRYYDDCQYSVPAIESLWKDKYNNYRESYLWLSKKKIRSIKTFGELKAAFDRFCYNSNKLNGLVEAYNKYVCVMNEIYESRKKRGNV